MLILWKSHIFLMCLMTTLTPMTAVTTGTPVSSTSQSSCPKNCVCSGPLDAIRVDCSNMNLTEIPLDILSTTSILDVSWNRLSELQNNVLSNAPFLQELNLANNILTTIPKTAFLKLSTLRTLYIQNNQFQKITSLALKPLVNLENLHLSSNRLESLDANSFVFVPRLLKLWLDDNQLADIPTSALDPLTRLHALNMASNRIEKIKDYAFQALEKLVILVLHSNLIESIEPKAFHGLRSLKVLEINNNKFMILPEAISSLPSLRELTFAENAITFLDAKSFQMNPELALVEMSGNPISSIDKTTFSNLPHLKKLVLSEARMLSEFPDLTGTLSLEHLKLDRASLKSVPPDICDRVPLLRSLNLKSNQLTDVPVIHGCTELRLIDLSYNFITAFVDKPFAHQGALIDLFLGHNQLSIVHEDSFMGLESLQVLDLENNNIQSIHPDAFRHFKELRDLNLGENRFSQLPTKGLKNLRELKTFNNRELKDFPPIDNFPKISTLALSYAYHCCAFSDSKSVLQSKSNSPFQETIVWLSKDDVDMASWNANITDVWPGYENFSTKFEEFANQLWKTFGRDYPLPDNLAQYAEEYFESNYGGEDHSTNQRFLIQCLPEPGPFMPCTDLFGWWSLRCGVWVVFLLALLGNGIVVIVLLVGRSKMDVPRFLVCNLAGADFFMGIYLGMLAVVDASTLGEFKVSAVKWQTSIACQVAGFLGVLSSELSVFTLSVITLERNYAITHAMHLNKRLSLRHAGYIMFFGWTFASVMATLPLMGISDYRKFAICLPFETEDAISLSYVVFLILINGVAFLILMGCYLKMYCAIRGSQAWNSNDSRIARRMALLVFTDFICWAPIAFFSLTAVCGVNLVSLEEAKVFAIFVLPLNSCANPFLYAIFTKQFKKDCIHICKRIEESRVTRGIGRGRHSSNFSNRHTPITTNSGGGAPIPLSSDQNMPHQERLYNPEYGVCNCGINWKPDPIPRNSWKRWAFKYLLCQFKEPKANNHDSYTYAIAQIQRNIERRHKHASSISSENFSSRSDSWRQGNIPLRLMDQVARRGSRTYQRKSSQDSNISCSRQDSSTSTFRMSRSSFSTDSSNQHRASCSSKPPVASSGWDRDCRMGIGRDGKPKLCRQAAVEESQTRRTEFNVDASKAAASDQQREKICAFCSRKTASSPPILKGKDVEQKFSCFYNRLAESSHENPNDAVYPKENQLILLSDASTLENSVAMTSKQPLLVSVGSSTPECLPVIDNFHSAVDSVEPTTPQQEYGVCEIESGPLCIECKKPTAKCLSLTNIDAEEQLQSGRKFTSDNSLVRIPVQNANCAISSQTMVNEINQSAMSTSPRILLRSENIFYSSDRMIDVESQASSLQKNPTDWALLKDGSRSKQQIPHCDKHPNDNKMKTAASTPNIPTTKWESFPLIEDKS